MLRVRTAVFTFALALFTAAPALADATVFVGANLTPSARMTKGAALGMGFSILGFEIEYCDTAADPASAAPSLTTGMANGYLQTPFPVLRLQPYVTVGAGVYRETLGAHEDTSAGVNVGGGVKFTLIGPLKVRADYRVFKLGSGALSSPAHRFYVGANVSF